MTKAWDTLVGLVRLAGLVAASGFRLRGAYWTWRRHTAFGAGPEPRGMEKVRAALGYARWVGRMRRMSRAS
jgi:hypothetical protein